MSFLRRAAAASVIAVALATCGAAPSALAAPSTPADSSASAAVPSDGEPGGARPIQMGPFTFPSTGQLQGGFGWNTTGGGY
ncbi:hypothetical protein AB0I82_26640 [Streptomyces sp. NPDC050315]|uniref:hypothetical protein n=1 Tax=Streptomyces sp. NPDC050315 TaxID=3155039 RepID=UPI003436A60B